VQYRSEGELPYCPYSDALHWHENRYTSVKGMSADHRCSNTFMSQQFLDGANVIAIFEQVSGKTVAQGVATHSCF